MPKSSLHFVFGRSLSYYNIKKHLLEIYWIWFWLSLCPSEYSLRYNINMRNFANFILIIIYKDIIYLNQILCHDQYLKSTILFTVSLHHIDNSTLRLFHVPDSVTVLLVHLSACCVCLILGEICLQTKIYFSPADSGTCRQNPLYKYWELDY